MPAISPSRIAAEFRPSDVPSTDPADPGSRSFRPKDYILQRLHDHSFADVEDLDLERLVTSLEHEDAALKALVLDHLDVFVRCKDAIDTVYSSDRELFSGAAAEDVELQYNDLRTNCADVVAPLFGIREEASRMRRLQTLLMRVSSVSHVPSGVRSAADATDVETAVQALIRAAQFHERQREASRRAVSATTEAAQKTGGGDDSSRADDVTQDAASEMTESFAGASTTRPLSIAQTLKLRGFFAAWLDAVIAAGIDAVDRSISQLCSSSGTADDDGDDAGGAGIEAASRMALLEEVLGGCTIVLRVTARLYASKLVWLRDVRQDSASSAARIPLRAVVEEQQGLRRVHALGTGLHPVKHFGDRFGKRLTAILQRTAASAAKPFLNAAPPTTGSYSDLMAVFFDPADGSDTAAMQILTAFQREDWDRLGYEGEGGESADLAPALLSSIGESQRSIDAIVGTRVWAGCGHLCNGRKGSALVGVALRAVDDLIAAVSQVYARVRSLIASGTFNPSMTNAMHRDGEGPSSHAPRRGDAFDGTTDPLGDLDPVDRRALQSPDGGLLLPPECPFSLKARDVNRILEDSAVMWVAAARRVLHAALLGAIRCDLESVLVMQRAEALERREHDGRSGAWQPAAMDLPNTAVLLPVLSRWSEPMARLASGVSGLKPAGLPQYLERELDHTVRDTMRLHAAGVAALGKARLAALLPVPLPITVPPALLDGLSTVAPEAWGRKVRFSADLAVDACNDTAALMPRLGLDTPSTLIPVAFQCFACTAIAHLMPLARLTEEASRLPGAAQLVAGAVGSAMSFAVDCIVLRGMAAPLATEPERSTVVPYDSLAMTLNGGQLDAATTRVARAQTILRASRRIVAAVADVIALDAAVSPAVVSAVASAAVMGCADPDTPTFGGVTATVATIARDNATGPMARRSPSLDTTRRGAEEGLRSNGLSDLFALAVRRLSSRLERSYGSHLTSLVISGGFRLPGFDWQSCLRGQPVRAYLHECLAVIVEAADEAAVLRARGAVSRDMLQRLVAHVAVVFTEELLRLDCAGGGASFAENATGLLAAEAAAWRAVCTAVRADAGANVLEYRASSYLDHVAHSSGGKLGRGSVFAKSDSRAASAFVAQHRLLLSCVDGSIDSDSVQEQLRREAVMRRASRWKDMHDDVYAAEAASAARREARQAKQQQQQASLTELAHAKSERGSSSSARPVDASVKQEAAERADGDGKSAPSAHAAASGAAARRAPRPRAKFGRAAARPTAADTDGDAPHTAAAPSKADTPASAEAKATAGATSRPARGRFRARPVQAAEAAESPAKDEPTPKPAPAARLHVRFAEQAAPASRVVEPAVAPNQQASRPAEVPKAEEPRSKFRSRRAPAAEATDTPSAAPSASAAAAAAAAPDEPAKRPPVRAGRTSKFSQFKRE